jgi:hypothetical protein
MSLPARLRLTLARSPWLYWAIVATLAGAAGLLVMRAVGGIEAQRAGWGRAREVLVAQRDVAPGDPLAGVVASRPLPAPMIPPEAVTAVDEAAVARQRIAAGEVVVGHDVAAAGAPQSLIPVGWLAVAVAEPVASGAQVGDAVAVATAGVVLAAEGLVVGIVGAALIVAVPAAEAAQVAHAASAGDVSVLLQP